MAELQFPNIVGQYQQSYDRGRGQLADKLAGQAYSAQGADRQSALSQLAGVDPRTAMAMGDRFQQQDQAQQAQAKAQDVDHAQKLNGAARFMLQAVATKDPARIQGSWQAVRPYLAELSGKEPPAQFDPAMLPKMYEILGQTGGAPEQKGTVVAPGGALVDSATGQQMFANPAAQQYHDVPMGDGRAAGVFNPADGTIRPATVGGSQPSAPAGDPMQPFIDQANHAVQLGADPDKVQAWLVSQAQGAGLNPQAPGAAQPQAQGQAPAQFGIGTPKAGTQVRTLTDAELKQYNLPAGTVAQVDGNGRLNVVNKGDISSGLTDDAAGMLSTAAQQGYKIPIPSLGMKSGGDRTKFLNKLAADVKTSGVDMPTAIRNMVYGQAGIFATNAMQKNYGMTMQNEMSAQRQADIALDASSKLGRTDVQALNQWWLTGKKQFGNVEAQNYANAINTFAEEYAKVMSGANGSAAATDSSRAKAHEMINTGLSQDQMSGVVDLMKREMRGRTQGQLDAIQSQVKGLRDFGGDEDGADHAGQGAQAPQQAAPQSAQPRAVNPQTGHAIVWNGSAWVPE